MTVLEATLSNGDVYVIDTHYRIVRPKRADASPAVHMIADWAATLLDTGDLIGPQVDDLVGVRGDWGDPDGPLAAMIDAARGSRLQLRVFRDLDTTGA